VERLAISDFDGRDLRRPGSVVVAFVAQWCGFCREFEPRFRALEPLPGCALALADVSDQSSPLWETFGIEVVPTVIGFVEGALRWRRDGELGEGLTDRDVAAIQAACAGV
jgi:thiol-disulfide isomerase/thioredoxin